MRRFPDEWLKRLNELVTVVRRRQGWGDIYATVDAPAGPDHPPILRLEHAGALITVPLDVRAVELMVRTGQEGPLLVELKQAFMRVVKTSERRAARKAAPARKKSF